MDADGLEPESIERDFPGWVAWTTVRRLWYARPLKTPDVTLHADSSNELRLEIQTWLERNGGGK